MGDSACSGHRRDSTAGRAVLLAAYLLSALLPLLVAYVLNPPSGKDLLRELGKGVALLGCSLLVLQFVLGARLHLLDRVFGLDVVMRYHKAMAVVAGVLILLHPVLLSLGYGNWSLFRMDTSPPIVVGKVGLALLVLTIFLAFAFRKLGIDYNVWHLLHKSAVLVVILGFVHGFAVGADLRSTAMKTCWAALFLIAMALFLFRNVYVPLIGRRRFRVKSVKQESHDTWTLAFEPENGVKTITHAPGQFWFLKLVRPGRRSELHPFTISSSPIGEPPLTSTIKESGNFTNTIGQTKPDDKASIEGPYGRFSLVNYAAEAFVFIAGGVGITPIMSMLRYLRDTGDPRPAVLIYGNKTERDILFRNELSDMPTNIRVTHVLSSPDRNWEGQKGFVTTDVIRRETGNLVEETDVYLCGPTVMMDKVIKSLKELDVSRNRIHYERFTI